MLDVLHACLHARWARVHECVCAGLPLCSKGGEEGTRRSNPVVEGMPTPTVRKEQVKERAKEFGEGGVLKNIHSFLFFLSNTFKEQCMNSSVSGGVQHFFPF